MHKAVGHLQKSTEVMKLMGSVLKHSVVAKQMTELSREMMKAGVMDEMVGEALDGVLDGPDAEEETEAEVDKVLSELAADTGRALPAAGRPARAAPAAAAARAEAHEEEDAAAGMQARLDALRAA